MIGKRFGMLVVLKYTKSTFYRKSELKRVLIKCDCGNKKDVPVRSIERGHTRSCGCLHKIKITKHGISNEKIYNVYRAMLQRCREKKHWLYPKYGGRGITVCDAWGNNPLEFKKWAISAGYNESLTIDREDNDKGYCPANCRFITKKQNMNNKSNTIYLKIEGCKISLQDAAIKYSIPASCIYQRVKKLKWSDKAAVTTPVRKKSQSLYNT